MPITITLADGLLHNASVSRLWSYYFIYDSRFDLSDHISKVCLRKMERADPTWANCAPEQGSPNLNKYNPNSAYINISVSLRFRGGHAMKRTFFIQFNKNRRNIVADVLLDLVQCHDVMVVQKPSSCRSKNVWFFTHSCSLGHKVESWRPGFHGKKRNQE